MKYTYLAIVVAAVIIVAGAGAYWFFFRPIPETSNTSAPSATLEANFSGDGMIVKDKPGFKEGAWYFEYDNSGKTETVHIVFSRISVCTWKETSGLCKPSVFVNGRKAHVEGTRLDDAIGVLKLTFTEPSPVK